MTWTIRGRGPNARSRTGSANGFHKILLYEFYRVAFRKKVYRSIDELQADLDSWIAARHHARGRAKPAGVAGRIGIGKA
jgi:hypothetical protein